MLSLVRKVYTIPAPLAWGEKARVILISYDHEAKGIILAGMKAETSSYYLKSFEWKLTEPLGNLVREPRFRQIRHLGKLGNSF